jgi:hypothetical protein
LTATKTITAGNSIVAGIYIDASAGTISNLSVNTGGSLTVDSNITNGTRRMAMAHLFNAPSGVTSVSITTSNADYKFLTICEVAGTTSVDTGAFSNALTTASGSTWTTQALTATAPSIAFAWVFNRAANGTLQTVTSSGWGTGKSGTINGYMPSIFYKELSGAGTDTPSGTVSSGDAANTWGIAGAYK